MAKKIRNVKLKSEDIQKNSGKNISHTISKIKAHERFYTTILVLVFMVIISLGIYIAIRVNPYYIYAEDLDRGEGFSYTSRLIYLNQKNIGDKDNEYEITLSNMTNNNINYIMRMVPDDESINACNCGDSIISYTELRYSLEDTIERSFSDSNMIFTTGNIHPLERETIPIKIWIREDFESDNCNFYGKIVLEKIEDMNNE